MRSWHLLLLILFLLTVLLPLRCQAQKDPLFDDDESLDELDLLDEDEDHKPVKKSEPKPTPTPAPPVKMKTPSVPIVTEDDDDDMPIDDDEFVGHESTPPPKPKKEKTTNKPKTPPQVTLTLATPSSYWPEVCAIISLVIYGLNYLWGRSRNDAIANRWLSTCNELFMIHFAATGVEDIHLLMETDENKSVDEQFRAGHVAHHQRTSPILVKDSASCYKLYATGRRYCTGMLATIELRKRQDLFAWLLAAVDMSTTQDTVTYEIPMSDDDMDPFVFAIVRKKHEKMIRKREKDLENYATLVKSSRLPSTLCLLTDAPELESELIDDRVFRTLTDLEPYFISLHFSDQSPASFTTSKKVLRFTYRLPTDLNQMDIINKLTRMSLHFIDRIGSMKLTSGMRTRAEQKRKIVADRAYKATHQQRQEELLRRKAELKRKEEENAPPLTAEQQRRKEEREYKLQQKKNETTCQDGTLR